MVKPPIPTSEHISVIRLTNRKIFSGNRVWEVKCSCGKVMYWSKRQIIDYHSCGCRSAEMRKLKVWKGCGEVSGAYFGYMKKNARTRNLECSITVQDAWDKYVKQGGRCALSNEAIHFGTESENQTASLDRIDSSKGYTIDNIQWLHKKVNFMKQQYSEFEFVGWCRKIVEHQQGKFENTVKEEFQE